MITFIKKHKMCSIFIVFITAFFVYIKFWFVLPLPVERFHRVPVGYTEEEWQERQLNFRRYWEPIDITILNTKQIHYHNHSGKYYHCFGLGFEEQMLNNKIKDFNKKYLTRYSKKSDAEFDLVKKDKPHLRVRIYHKNVLQAEQEVYMIEVQDVSYPFETNGQKITLQALNGYSNAGELACYHFADNTDYEIEITNLIPFHEYKGIQVFFRISTGKRYSFKINKEQ